MLKPVTFVMERKNAPITTKTTNVTPAITISSLKLRQKITSGGVRFFLREVVFLFLRVFFRELAKTFSERTGFFFEVETVEDCLTGFDFFLPVCLFLLDLLPLMLVRFCVTCFFCIAVFFLRFVVSSDKADRLFLFSEEVCVRFFCFVLVNECVERCLLIPPTHFCRQGFLIYLEISKRRILLCDDAFNITSVLGHQFWIAIKLTGLPSRI